jgi:hypothetical protein
MFSGFAAGYNGILLPDGCVVVERAGLLQNANTARGTGMAC